MSADAPDGATDDAEYVGSNDETRQFEFALVEPRNGYINIKPPTWGRRVVHSWPYYIVAIGMWPAGLWILAGLADWHIALRAPAIALTVVAGILYTLRYKRGSLLDVENEQIWERQRYYSTEHDNPRSLAITPCNRIGKRLEENEYVVWEFRQHPISLLVLWWKRIFLTKWGWGTLAVYSLIMSMLLWGNLLGKLHLPGLVGVIFALLPSVYFWYTITEWNSDRLALTNRRFIGGIGLLETEFGGIPRASIQDQNDTRTKSAHFIAWLRVINTPYGKLVFETPGPIRGNLPEVTPRVPDIAHRLTMHRPRRILE